nr:MAG TPA: hypothetical protein [Caudoviricetes sp.]
MILLLQERLLTMARAGDPTEPCRSLCGINLRDKKHSCNYSYYDIM